MICRRPGGRRCCPRCRWRRWRCRRRRGEGRVRCRPHRGRAQKIQVIKEVRGLTSLGLKEAKDLVDGVPANVLEAVDKETADKAKEVLEAAGASVELKQRPPRLPSRRPPELAGGLFLDCGSAADQAEDAFRSSSAASLSRHWSMPARDNSTTSGAV